MAHSDRHPLPNLSLGAKLLSTGALLIGAICFLSVGFAVMLVAGWGVSASIVLNLGELLLSLRQTLPGGFWLVFGLHTLSLVLVMGVSRGLVRRMALPRGFRLALILVGLGLGSLDLIGWLLLPFSGLARALLPFVMLLLGLVLLVSSALPLVEMWVYTRWGGAPRPQRVVIVGGGFGGLYAAMELDRRLGYHKDLEIILVDKKNYFLFPPLLPSVATGAIESRQVTYPFRRVFEATNVHFRKESVESIDPQTRTITTRATVAPDPDTGELRTRSSTLEYDYLVLAPGAATNTFNTPGAEQHAFFMRELGDAIAVRNHIIDCFEQAGCERDPALRQELLRFVVVGAGPTGVELAAEVQDLIHHVLLRRYPEIEASDVEVWLIQSGEQVLPGWHGQMASRTAEQLGRIQVKVVLGARVVGVSADAVQLKDQVVRTRTVVWCAGVKPSPLMERCGLPLNKRGLVEVGPDLRVPGLDKVFVVGDVAQYTDPKTGKPLPALAQVALQQGTQTAPNIVRLLKGQTTRQFKYFNYGALICVGEHYAVVDLMGMRLSGVLAWFIWRSLYLAKLVGFSNKVRVVIDWTLDLLVERSISQLWTSRLEVQAVKPAAPELAQPGP